MYPFLVNIDESGERHLFHSTSERYPSNTAGDDRSLAARNELDAAMGSDGTFGSGAYLMNWKGETSAAGRKLQQLRKEGMAERVWEHTTNLLDRTVR